MELLREWFLWGESDLFFFGIGIIIIFALFPIKLKKRENGGIIGGCFIIYAVCELVVTFWFQNWMFTYICLFVGGIALSVALGRIIRAMILCWPLRKKKS